MQDSGEGIVVKGGKKKPSGCQYLRFKPSALIMNRMLLLKEKDLVTSLRRWRCAAYLQIFIKQLLLTTLLPQTALNYSRTYLKLFCCQHMAVVLLCNVNKSSASFSIIQHSEQSTDLLDLCK